MLKNTNRRDFLKKTLLGSTGVAMTNALFASQDKHRIENVAHDKLPAQDAANWKNWSGIQSATVQSKRAPCDLTQLRQALAQAPKPIRAVGSGHSFSALVPTPGTVLSMARFDGVQMCTQDCSTDVEIMAGAILADVNQMLWKQGRSIDSLPDIDRQSIAGAIATSTHGTGRKLGSLSEQLTQIQLMTSAGELLECSPEKNKALFYAASTNLGALGIVTQVRMKTQAKFYLTESAKAHRLKTVLANIESLNQNNRGFEMFVFPYGKYALTLETNIADKPQDLPVNVESTDEGILNTIDRLVDVVPFMRAMIVNTIGRFYPDEMRTGRSYEIMSNTRDLRFNEMEYTVPAKLGPQCLDEILYTIKKEKLDVVFPIEYRYSKADNVWLSPFYQRAGCSISIHQFIHKQHHAYFSRMEQIFKKYQGRPHWGKLHSLGAGDLSQLYPKWDDFLTLRAQLDPKGAFLNAHLKQLFALT